MPKFFVKDEQVDGENIKIVGEDVNHIVNVLRLKKEDEVQICNANTNVNYIANIINMNKKIVECKIKHIENSTNETNIDITLFQGLPKADKMEYIIQKNVELGVKHIVPVDMERSIVKLDEKTMIKKIERWQKISEVAAKQCGRNIIPKIKPILNLKNICNMLKEYDIVLLAYEKEEKITIKQELNNIKENLEKRKIKIYRTDKMGEICIKITKKAIIKINTKLNTS